MAGDESTTVEDDWSRWLTPRQAVDALRQVWDGTHGWDVARTEIHSRLRADLLRAFAETFVISRDGQEKNRGSFVEIEGSLWPESKSNLGTQFWEAGHLTVHRYSYGNPVLAFWGVRLDPDQIAAIVASQSNKSVVADGQPTSQPKPTLNPLPKAEAERFATAILHGWPSASQDWAHERLLAFFPEHTMSREAFRVIFRAIQGPKKRGRKPKDTN